MRVQYVLIILLVVLPTQLTGITTTHHDKKTDPGEPIIVAEMIEDEVDRVNSSDSAERQRRLVPYMTFYLSRDYNRPSLRQQQYHLVPQKGTNTYPDKYIVTSNYQPKYAETPPILYQPKITYTPFLESNKLPGGFTPMHSAQPIRVQVLRGSQQSSVDEPNYSSIFDKLLQLKQVNPPYVVPQYPKLNVATQYYTRNYARPVPSKVVTFENYQSEPRYKAVPAKTFIHTYTPANIDIPTNNKVQNFENFESLKTYSQIPSPVPVKDYDRAVLPVKTYTQVSPQSAPERAVKVITVNQKEPTVYQEDYQKTPVKVYQQTVNQDSYQKLPSQPALPVSVYQSVNQESYQNGQKVYQSLPPVTVEDYQSGNQGEYRKGQLRPVKVYQQIYQDDYQPGGLEKVQPGTGAVYQTITQEVYQQQPQQGMVKPGGDYQPIDTKPGEVVSQLDGKYRPENLPDEKYQPENLPVDKYQPETLPVDKYQPENLPTGKYQPEHLPVDKYQPENLPSGKYQPETLPTGKYQPVNLPDYSQTVQGTSDPLRPVYQPTKPYQIGYATPEITTEAHTLVATENPHSLSVILKQLQESNTLPQTLTPDNIDNSIKTLVQILNALKHTQKFQRPIVVAPGDEADASADEDYEDDVLPGTVSQNFPANTVEGGTPGKPGVDYPAHAQIPQTSFNCKKQRYKGFFGDPDTNCQVWHYCDLNGGQASFLCPNGTIFSQVALTCDWWYNVKCATTTQLYVLNERLYKYILPFTPKFPEDYSGPLVDRYLALKFKEMEEKMKKQKKGKPAKPAEDVQDHERNTLQDIEDESGAETQEHTTIVAPDEKN